MARPLKSGLDYFPLDVDIDQDDKVAMIEADYGIEGFGVLIKILMKIYKEGYYYEWSEREQKLFSRRVNVDINSVKDIVNACINEGIFDKGIFDEHMVLTSKGIQERFLEATKRRKNEQALNEYCLINVRLQKAKKTEETNKNTVNVNINSVNDNYKLTETIVNDDISTQSKVKESKGKEKKVKNITDFDLKSSERLYELILISNPGNKKPNLEQWANDVRLMRERDGRTEEQISYLIEWSQNDSFWKSNILSTGKLREKFDQLVIKIKSQKENNNNGRVTQTTKNRSALDKLIESEESNNGISGSSEVIQRNRQVLLEQN